MDIRVIVLDEAEDFLDGLDEKARSKVFYNINKTKSGIQGEWFQKMSGTEEIWEFRTLLNKTYYRVFAFWHRIAGKETLIVCTNGLVKKTDRTPPGEIERAERIRREFIKNVK
jgi:phage-related protein